MDLSAFRGGADNAAAYEALVGTTGTIPSPSFLPKVAPLAIGGALGCCGALAGCCGVLAAGSDCSC